MNLPSLLFKFETAKEFTEAARITQAGGLHVIVDCRYVRELRKRMRQLGMGVVKDVRRLNRREITFAPMHSVRAEADR